ncbi:hypothetical protein SEMRO_929_G221320.1 [Seminavis robusta]|uniref:Uncharacterized protein n=1 Tax=Seminavis robusta TaxID=568900 RepID=A0A9N8HKB2_9STRA|nr:hypothetical protein SEMRO_929_G221320.1 [Seminavis robusta]|eukprot:Sro929_g221320.1 n/a (380) ;mRNA; f:17963-19386
MFYLNLRLAANVSFNNEVRHHELDEIDRSAYQSYSHEMHADDIDDGFKTDSEDDAASQLSLKLDTGYWDESVPFDLNAFGSPTLAPFDPMSPQYQGTRSVPPTPQQLPDSLSAQLDTAADATTILSDPDAYPSGDEQRFSTDDEHFLEPTIPSNLKSPPPVQPSADNDDEPDVEEFLSDHEYDDEYIASDVTALTPRASRLYSATDDEDDAFDTAIRSSHKPAARSLPEVQISTIASTNSFETTAVASVNSFEITADISPVELSSSPPATPKIANTQPDAADDNSILDYMIPATSTMPSLVAHAMPGSSMMQRKLATVPTSMSRKKKSKKKKKKATCPSTSNICAELFAPTNKESDSSSSSPTSSEGSNSKPSPTQDFA